MARLHERGCAWENIVGARPHRAVMLISQSIFLEKEKPGMGHRLLFVAAIVLGLAPVSASAEGILHRASCSVVRYYVAKYSASMAEAYARSKGATEAEIEAARRCLDTGSSRVRTAQDTH
jgi:hypothetical protein